MRIALFSDIHGNLPSLEIALEESGKVDGYFILGDVVNYGPWSNECVKLIDTLPNCIKILGNHEEYFIKQRLDCKNVLVEKFFDQCFPSFFNKEIIKSYQKESIFENFICTHTLENRYIFQDTDIGINKNYIIGHSHQQYEINRNGFKILNPGSVGQNRKYINEINFMIYDTIRQKPDFRSVLYDVEIVIKQMENMGYPKQCLDYYRKKQRK